MGKEGQEAADEAIEVLLGPSHPKQAWKCHLVALQKPSTE